MSLQQFEDIPVESLLDRARAMKEKGCRLAQIGATTLPDCLEVVYSFAREMDLENVRLRLPTQGARIPSVSSIFWCAFLYENEIHDLFGVEVTDMAIDFKGNLYTTAVQYAFGSKKAPAPAEAAQPAPPSNQK